ncbi:hypothetical protein [Kribbella sp. NPDC051620]|uniref:hypothetical protein n=1 Tax=Kribbella sp. NPDC051620 TaxID=3364120 RepID=UPI00379EC987
MPDELKDKFQQLVADPPPPTAVPSEAVFAKVRTVRRRRTAGVAVLAAAAVAAIAVAGNNLTDINSTPPVSGTPGPTIAASAPPSSTSNATTGTVGTTKTTKTGTTGTTGSVQPTGPAKPSSSGTQTHNPPASPPVAVTVSLLPRLTGRSLTMKVTVKGTLISPLGIEGDGSSGVELPGDTSFLNRTLGTTYLYGDGEESGSDGGAVTCTGAKKRVTSKETYTLMDGPHVYKKAGTYTFKYTVQYCGTKNQTLKATKTAQIVVP